MSEKHLESLNKQQKEAVVIMEGPAIVSSPPGSGKTRVIVHRVANLIDKGVNPNKIMVATFTRKAARELKERVGHIIGADSEGLVCGTFHSICLSLLRDLSDDRLEVISEPESKAIISELLTKEELNLKTKDVLLDISYLKAWMMTPIDVMARSKNEMERKLARVYLKYEKYLKENNLVDFDNILKEAYSLFNKTKNKKHIQGLFEHILVDEYQDVNYVQGMILNFLADKTKSVFAVGDPGQAVYGFLGANLNEFYDFPKRYNNCQSVILDVNYRSGKNIIEASNAVMKGRINIWMRPASNENSKVIIVNSLIPEHEIEKVISLIGKLEGTTAILARAGWQLSPLIDSLMKRKIKFEELHDTSREINEAQIRESNLYLLTIHASKGLEFDNVIVLGLEEGILPYKDTEDVEEERRLFYVAMTRARKQLFISVCSTRNGKPIKLSRFLDKLPKGIIERS